MKYATMWWGIQILADTDEDEIILKSLIDSLPKEAHSDYEYGEVKTIDKENQDFGGFKNKEIKESKMVIEFCR